MEGSNRCSKKSFFVKIWKLVFSCSLLHIFWFMVHHHQILAQLSLLHPFVMKEVSTQNFFLKMGQSQPLFVYFVLFKHKFYRKNCRRQQDSNSDRRSRRRVRWPLDHHHGPISSSYTCLVIIKPVKQEVSSGVILPPMVSVFSSSSLWVLPDERGLRSPPSTCQGAFQAPTPRPWTACCSTGSRTTWSRGSQDPSPPSGTPCTALWRPSYKNQHSKVMGK